MRHHDFFDRQLDQCRGRNIDRERYIDAELGKNDAGLERAGQGQFRQSDDARFARARHERRGQQDAVLRMARAGIGFRAGELFFAQIDLRLIPELDPFVVERLLEFDAGGGRRHSELVLQDNLDDRFGFVGLLEHRQHIELVLDADVLDMIEHRGAAVARQLHGAAKAARAEGGYRFDGVGGVQRDIVEDEIGYALFG